LSVPSKARLIELDDAMTGIRQGGKDVSVQFNPETLKIQYANQIQTNSSGGGDQSQGNSGRQFVGAGTTKLSVQLWFDATSVESDKDGVDDVRRMTQEVTFFITPKPDPNDSRKFLPPGVRFLWGSLLFDGLVDSLEESLEYFSPEGKPLRASITLGLSQQKILRSEFQGDGKVKVAKNAPKTTAQTPMQSGQSVQSAAGASGVDWQSVASAAGVENPRFPGTGTLVDMASGLLGRN
jgi:hypothetical protein